MINKVQVFLSNSLIISEVFITLPTVNSISMITHKSSLLELCTLRAGEQHPPGHGGAHAQQVGGAGGGDVCIVSWHLPKTREHVGTSNLEFETASTYVKGI